MVPTKMKLIFCVTLLFTLSNLNVESSVIGSVEKSENSNKTEIADLNADCMLVILEKLFFIELINMAQLNDEFSALAADVYRRKYSHLPVVITDHCEFSDELKKLLNQSDAIDAHTFDRIYRNHPHVFNRRPEVEEYDGITIRDYETIWNTFKHFGHEIKRLYTTTNSWTPREYVLKRALFGYLISEFSSESLVDVELQNVPDRLLEHITKPMINVQNVKLSYFSNAAEPVLFQKVETLFPRVNRFEVAGFELENASIKLDSVTTFVAGVGYSVSVANYYFPRLQTLHLDYVGQRFDEYLTFLSEHNHLRHLHFKRYLPTDPQFEQLTANLEELIELTMEYHGPELIPELSPNAIVDFLSSHGKVRRLNVINFQRRWRNELQERLQHGWTMGTIENGPYNKGLSFERE